MVSGRHRKLTDDERIIFAAIAKAAKEGLPCPPNEELLGLLPHRNSLSGIVKIIKRLEGWGLISVERYQRSRRAAVPRVGQTAEPSNKAPHWRTRPREMPSPSIPAVQRREPSIATQIFAEAQRLGKSPQDFLCDLTWAGWLAHRDSVDEPGQLRRTA